MHVCIAVRYSVHDSKLRAIWCGFVSYFLFALAYIMFNIDIEPEVQTENKETARAECAREGEKGGR